MTRITRSSTLRMEANRSPGRKTMTHETPNARRIELSIGILRYEIEAGNCEGSYDVAKRLAHYAASDIRWAAK